MIFNTLKDFYEQYEMPLAHAFYHIDQRGLLIDAQRLQEFKVHLQKELDDACKKIEPVAGCKIIPQAVRGEKTAPGTLNLSSVPALKKFITETLHIKLPKTQSKKGGQHVYEESTGEEALNEAYAKTGHPALKEILRVRELNKIRGTYANATLLDSVLYSSYAVAGTKTGRRSSRETPFTSENGHKIGTNTQNLPKQSELGKKYRYCVIARPGKIFLSSDQVQAEDWVVSGIISDVCGDTKGLDELRNGIDRHKRLAAQIFQKPEHECIKGTMFRFMGKKTRHAGNYGMQAAMMSSSLAKEGFSLPVNVCGTLLERFHTYEPEIRNSFQHSIEDTIRKTRILRTPVGREYYFFGLRPDADNSKIFKEGFAYIPQSTVGDNTGLSILFCERELPGLVVMDTHDAITLELDDNEESILRGIELLRAAFHRVFTFPRGTQIEIPIEFTLGYDLKNEMELTCQGDVRTGLRSILSTLRQPRSPQSVTTSGAPQQQSAAH